MSHDTMPSATFDQGCCAWAVSDPLMRAYHDEEWGVPLHDSRDLWEKLILDGFQAGLSWLTVLRKREAFREAFEGFDPERIATWGERDIERLLQNEGIIRSRAKIAATIGNAQAWLAMEQSGEGFAAFVWREAGGRTLQPRRQSIAEVPARTGVSESLSKALRQRGFKFVGPVIVYAWMQAVGMVNDHTIDCHRYRALGGR